MRYNIHMAILIMLGWWYGRGWLWVIHSIGTNLQRLGRIFAVNVLLKTWFSPWKQIYSPSTFRTFFISLIDNAVSRVIGSFVRGTMLFCAGILAVLVVLFGLMAALLWPLLPLAVIVLPILALTGTGA
jgi:hypothetical protein